MTEARSQYIICDYEHVDELIREIDKIKKKAMEDSGPDTNRREIPTSPDTSERDDLIRMLVGVYGNYQSLIDNLAAQVIAWSDQCIEARQRVAELEKALDRSKKAELVACKWLQEKRAWAALWKRAAKRARFDLMRHHWHDGWKSAKRRVGAKQFREKANEILDLLGQPRITPE